MLDNLVFKRVKADNLDELINVLDIVLILSFILNNHFNIYADMNFDGTLNVTDIIVLVNQILSN